MSPEQVKLFTDVLLVTFVEKAFDPDPAISRPEMLDEIGGMVRGELTARKPAPVKGAGRVGARARISDTTGALIITLLKLTTLGCPVGGSTLFSIDKVCWESVPQL